MTAVDGIRPESAGIPNGKTPDSALRGEERRTGNPTSSRSDAQRRGREVEEAITSRIRQTPQALALARIILDLRPDWDPAAVHAWALSDDRPWAVVVAVGVTRCTDRDVRHPNGLRTTGPQLETSPTPPPALHEHRAYLRAIRDNDCGHGDLADRCPLCRRNLPALEDA